MNGTRAVAFVVVHLAAAAMTFASPVTVDFASLGSNAVDITVPGNLAGVTISGVNMLFDSYGIPGDYANVDAAGIYGSSQDGPVVLSFNTGVAGTVSMSVHQLDLDFSLEEVSGPVPDPDNNGPALLAYVSNADGSVSDIATAAGVFTPYDPAVPTLGSVSGHLSYSGVPLDQATLFFALPSADYPIPVFTVSNVTYDTAPEPVTMGLLAAGAVTLLRRRKN